MCDKEFKELVKIAVEKLKDESVLKLLQADASYQKDSNNEGSAEYNVPIDVDMNFDPNPILWTLENALIPIRGHQTVPLLW